MKDGSTLYCCSPIRFKTLFTKPLRYVIQLFTASAIEHAAFYVNGKVLHIDGDGSVYIPFKQWIKKYCLDLKVYVVEPIIDFKPLQVEEMIKYCIDNQGVIYGPLYAAYAYLDEVKIIRNVFKRYFVKNKANEEFSNLRKNYCSGMVFDAYISANIFVKQIDKLTPIELLEKQYKSRLFLRWRKIKDA